MNNNTYIQYRNFIYTVISNVLKGISHNFTNVVSPNLIHDISVTETFVNQKNTDDSTIILKLIIDRKNNT